MFGKTVVFAALMLCGASTFAAPITYGITLLENTGSVLFKGGLTLEETPVAQYYSLYPSSQGGNLYANITDQPIQASVNLPNFPGLLNRSFGLTFSNGALISLTGTIFDETGTNPFDFVEYNFSGTNFSVYRSSLDYPSTVPEMTRQFGSILFTSPVPEPATYALMLAGLAAVGGFARRRR